MKNKIFICLLFILLFFFFWGKIFSGDNVKVNINELKNTSRKWINQNSQLLIEISDNIWEYAETALEEYKSTVLLIETLESAGFDIKKNAAGMPTSFIASYGKGKPIIGLLAEYDALPGLSQKKTTKKEPVLKNHAGHGCGHNLIAAATLGTVLGIKHILDIYKIPGTIKIFGCPAEEAVGSKIYLARAGLFGSLSAVIAWHPGNANYVDTGYSLALNAFKVSFKGRSSHASGSPWLGRSALDAVELMNIGVNYLREHIPPSARLHYIVTEGGYAANVVPDFAEVLYNIRDKSRENVNNIYSRIKKIVKGASLMSETDFKIELTSALHSMLLNIAGSRVVQKNLEIVGPQNFSAKDNKFVKSIQKAYGVEQTGMNSKIFPLEIVDLDMGGSSDVAEVSRIVPTVFFWTACIAPGIPGHSWGVVSCAANSIGHKGMISAVKVMSMTVIDFLCDHNLLKKMWVEFIKNTKGKKYKSPLPLEHKFSLPNRQKKIRR